MSRLVRFAASAALPVALAGGGLDPARAGQGAVIPGSVCEPYADVPGAESLSFDDAGNLFVGRGIPGGNGAESVKIHRVPPGGGLVEEYGADAIPDPDGVLVDGAGSISGTAGSVLVCGDAGGNSGQIVAVRPDGGVVAVFSPAGVLSNPNYMAAGRDGLLLSDSTLGKVFEFVAPGPPAVLIDSPSIPYHIAVDASGRIFVSHADGVIRAYDADGAELDGSYATGLGAGAPLALGRGGAFGTDLYAMKPGVGELVRVAPDRSVTVVGTGFPTDPGGMAFGPDGALYVSMFDPGQILRIAPAPVTSFFLPKKVTAKLNAKDPSKSTVVAGGVFDTGPDAPDFASAATLDVGLLHFDIPGLVQSGKVFSFSGAGVSFSIAPNPYGSSRAKFKLKFTGDFSDKVPLDGELALKFDNAVTEGGGKVRVGGGVFGIGKVRGALVEPNVFVVRAHANLRGGGKDAFAVIVGLATGGQVPAAASSLKVEFGENVAATIPADAFTRKGSADVFAGDAGGITKVTVDYAREQITIVGKNLDLGAFAQGGNTVRIGIGLGPDGRSVLVRMGRIGNTMKY